MTIFCCGLLVKVCSRLQPPTRRQQQEVEIVEVEVQSVHYIVQRDGIDEVYLNEECTVCLLGETDIQTSCQHFFHMACLGPWLMIKAVCPNCIRFLAEDQFLIYCSRCNSERLASFDELIVSLNYLHRRNYVCFKCRMV